MNDRQCEQIDQYIHGKMSSQEHTQFEEQLQANLALATYIDAYQMIEEEMEDYYEAAA